MSKKKETYLMKEMKERVGIERDPSGGELTRDFTKSERAAYGSYMRDYRAKYGLVDGLRTDREGLVNICGNVEKGIEKLGDISYCVVVF